MKKIILLFTVVLIISCSIKYVPVKTASVIIAEDIAIVENPEFTFAIENRYWIKEPDNLSDYFTTFFVTIKNKTSQKLELDPSDISLLDQLGNQFDVVSIDYLENMLLPDDFELNIKKRIDNTNPDYVEEWRDAKQNLITYSLHFGAILPGARKSGYIFYPKLNAKNFECRIIFKDNVIQFVRSDKKTA